MIVDDSRLRRLDSGYSVSAWVARTLEGTSALGGTFTVSYAGAETPPLPHNVSALEMKRALENLETLSVVTVEKNTSGTYGNAYWDVTFDSEAGDLPLMETTAGRLLNGGVLNGGVMPSTWVEQIEQGSPAVLVYDGSADPETRVFTAAGLSEDALYVQGATDQPRRRGILSARRRRSRAAGAAPARRRPSAAARRHGGRHWQQVVTALGWYDAAELRLRFRGGNWTSDLRGASADVERALSSSTWDRRVHVTRTDLAARPSGYVDRHVPRPDRRRAAARVRGGTLARGRSSST